MRTSSSLCRWLAAAIVFALGAGIAAAQEATPPPTPAPDCAECHLDVVAAWQDSIHAQAYHDPEFQTAWQAQKSDPACLSCHTTGFVARTGQYDQAGVTCTACHGETPATHPPEAVPIDPGVNVCADCHPTTVNEWEASLHGEQQLACTTCHTPHDQKVRFETANVLCLNCHDETRADYAHVSHPDQACIDCHWYRNLDETQHIKTGDLLPTGHDSQVETFTCVDCHAKLPENAQAVTPASPHPLTVAQVRIHELEAEVQTAQAQGENQAAAQLITGLVVGAVVMGIGVGSFSRLRRDRRQEE
ncbi:MAG: hypothetical protein HZC41_21790 [Chloroflexi bacterium]|nr:hypothetical protein [Chloroflexota bacterium]